MLGMLIIFWAAIPSCPLRKETNSPIIKFNKIKVARNRMTYHKQNKTKLFVPPNKEHNLCLAYKHYESSIFSKIKNVFVFIPVIELFAGS